MELAMLCDKQVYVMIFDPEKNKAVEYLSDPAFDASLVEKIAKQTKKMEVQLTKIDNSFYNTLKEQAKLKDFKSLEELQRPVETDTQIIHFDGIGLGPIQNKTTTRLDMNTILMQNQNQQWSQA